MGEYGPAQRLFGDVAAVHLFGEDGGEDEIRLGGVVKCCEQECVRAEPSEPASDGDRLPERYRGEWSAPGLPALHGHPIDVQVGGELLLRERDGLPDELEQVAGHRAAVWC